MPALSGAEKMNQYQHGWDDCDGPRHVPRHNNRPLLTLSPTVGQPFATGFWGCRPAKVTVMLASTPASAMKASLPLAVNPSEISTESTWKPAAPSGAVE